MRSPPSIGVLLHLGPRPGCGNPLLRCLVFLAVLLSEAGGVLGARPAPAAERTGPVNIGGLTESWGPTPSMVGLRDGLAALGYREGEQFVMGVRFTQGDVGALPSAARELVRNGADLIYASGTNATKAAQMATSQIPIVFAEAIGDPVESGLVQSFARPGGNITGVTDLNLELAPKRLEIFKELVPGLKRVLVPYDPTDTSGLAMVRMYRDAARQLGLVLVERPVRTTEEAQATLGKVRTGEADGIIATGSVALNLPGFILDATSQRRMPTMFGGAFYVERGALASYGPDFYQSGREAARLVDKILKGESPAEIPVETNPRVEMVVNLNVAKRLRLPIGPAVLRANRFIE